MTGSFRQTILLVVDAARQGEAVERRDGSHARWGPSVTLSIIAGEDQDVGQTSLSKKLGIKPGHKVLVMNAPEGYLQEIGVMPQDAEVATEPGGAADG